MRVAKDDRGYVGLAKDTTTWTAHIGATQSGLSSVCLGGDEHHPSGQSDQRISNPTSGSGACSINTSNKKFNNELLTISVQIPDDYTCSGHGCWLRIEYDYVGMVKDTTTWTAFISGTPYVGGVKPLSRSTQKRARVGSSSPFRPPIAVYTTTVGSHR